MLEGTTILLVEDELPVRKSISETLHRERCAVLEAHSARDALAVAETHKGTIDLLLADCEMPGMSGFDLAEQLQSAQPHLAVILMSGSTDDLAASHVRGWLFLRKPFAATAVVGTIEKALRENRRPINTRTAG